MYLFSEANKGLNSYGPEAAYLRGQFRKICLPAKPSCQQEIVR